MQGNIQMVWGELQDLIEFVPDATAGELEEIIEFEPDDN
jgi:hypothetical protein